MDNFRVKIFVFAWAHSQVTKKLQNISIYFPHFMDSGFYSVEICFLEKLYNDKMGGKNLENSANICQMKYLSRQRIRI